MKFIIDVSKWQGTVDWETVGKNVDGVILRVGRGTVLDTKFVENADACVKYGIPFGVYLYSIAENVDDAMLEAKFAIEQIKKYKMAYPIYFDTEQAGTETVSADCAAAFCDLLEASGYFAGVYASQYWWQKYLTPIGNRYTKWVARWSSSEPEVENTVLWQYTSNGKVDGITGRVDCSHLLDDTLPQIIVSKGFNNYTPATASNLLSTLTGTVTGNTVYIRSGAGTSYSILDIARKGETYEVLGSVLNGETRWWNITFKDDIQGFISGVYFKINE